MMKSSEQNQYPKDSQTPTPPYSKDSQTPLPPSPSPSPPPQCPMHGPSYPTHYPMYSPIQLPPQPLHYPVFPPPWPHYHHHPGFPPMQTPPPRPIHGHMLGIPMMAANNVHNPNAHALIRIQSRIERPWSTGLFGCLSDINSCFLTSLFPCITFGRIAEILDEGTISCGRSAILYILLWGLTFSPCLFTCLYRTKLRRKFTISETPCWDWIVHPLCQCCALCQEYRELQNRGFDMSIGYHENMALQNQTVAVFSTAPEVHTGTRR